MLFTTILLDFDGVISDSNSFKASNILEAASRFTSEETAIQFSDYFTTNNGIPRERKIFGYFEDPEQAQNILNAYNSLNKNLHKAGLTSGLTEFLDKNKASDLMVLSGGDTNEIKQYLKTYNIDQYFSSVMGGPMTKDEHMIKTGPLSNALFFGDTTYDYNIAMKFDLEFIFMYGYTSETDWEKKIPATIKRIKNFTEI
jgi:phosphoglycolate phosphatase-like HAD superfamily hydrolase